MIVKGRYCYFCFLCSNLGELKIFDGFPQISYLF